MFVEKFVIGTVAGGALGIILAILSLFKGMSWGEAGQVVMGSIIMGIIGMFWFTRHEQSHTGNYQDNNSDLHLQLQKAHDAMEMYERNGDHSRASQWRSQIAIIESQLRSRGA